MVQVPGTRPQRRVGISALTFAADLESRRGYCALGESERNRLLLNSWTVRYNGVITPKLRSAGLIATRDGTSCGGLADPDA